MAKDKATQQTQATETIQNDAPHQSAQQTETTTSGAKISNRLTIANVCGNVKKIVKGMGDGETRAIARMYGKADGLYQYVDLNGNPGFGLTGMFEGVNLETGEVFQSPKVFVPGALHGLMVQGVKNLNPGESIDFAVEIELVEDSTSNVGYHYEVKQLIKPSAVDPLASLRAQVPARTLGSGK